MNMEICIRRILCCVLFLTLLHETYEEPSELNYGYTFNVSLVRQCPLNKEDWDAASDRLNCTETQGYHCVPDKYMTSLVEFCYTWGKKLPFHEGNCLELAADGILNHFPCAKTFPCGCPDTFYYSNEIYKYPKCLQINAQLGCFNSDIQCMITKALTQTTNLTKEAEVFNFTTNCHDTNIQLIVTRLSNETTSVNNTYNLTQYERESRECDSCRIYVVPIVILLLLFIVVTVGWFYKRKKKNTEQSHKDYYVTSYVAVPSSSSSHEYSASTRRHDETLSKLVKACRNGDKVKYHSLTAPETFDKSLLIKKDNRGQTVLHHAVYGGSYDIVYDLLKFKEVDVCEKEYIGRTALHIAAKGDNVEIFDKILQKGGDKLLQYKDKNDLTPFCYAALAGKKTVVERIVERGFDIKAFTKYGESIAHLACIGGSLEILKMVSEKDQQCKRESSNIEDDEEENIIKRKNKMDWNPLQYAAKSGDIKNLKFLIENDVRVINSTEDLKSAFHSACENGRLEACKDIAKYTPECVHTTDKRGRHAGHFVAKCGNIEVLKFLVNECNLQADNPSSQKINILHIACRHGRLDMCVYIAQKYPHLVTQESKKGWNAALFLSEKGGADEERLKILQFLVREHNLFVHHVSRAGKTILYNACANRSRELCQHLLENYPDLLTIERSMDPRNVTSDPEILSLIERYSMED
ncbi:ankyrin repeat, PH and SEC7 domain containing protein secG-like isoform X2 [Ostrea edulis]|uniref:ankyrin repeat, PH and SEC7 domain containing protein secG-like isoform X2 n=1 Tax=Ostrea edulis TaxID=37623 RepID=UPI0024B00059|nr:ankyrin repeat, PH and SEC7 domain containing protein secG-like isoform X2 [Ostrea edulis]